MKTRTKKRKTKKLLIIIAAILVVIIVALGSIAIATVVNKNAGIKFGRSMVSAQKEDPLVPVLDENGYWTFTTDGDFVVLQLTDIHIGGGAFSGKKDSWAIQAVADLVQTVQPDLVIATGDIAYPVPFQSGSFNNLYPSQIFAETMESLGVYWTVIFGNHDTEAYSYYSREQISDFYASEKYNYALNPDAYCLYQAGPTDTVDGYGNYVINVKNTSGLVTQSFIMMDSHSYVDSDYLGVKWKYDNIHANQIEWYAQQIALIDSQNKAIDSNADMFKSLAFFHIPLVEYLDAYNAYIDNGQADTENVKWIYGVAGESGKIVYSGIGSDELFETMLELGSTQGTFVGHDHLNNFSIEYHGIRLTYGMSIDYLAYPGIYKKTQQRGGTVITVKTDGSFDCYGLRLADKQIID